jgi:hypothetical protein
MDKERQRNPMASEGKVKAAAARAMGISLARLYRMLLVPGGVPTNGGKVYLMRHSCGQYKIGFTSGSPRFREETLMAIDPRVELVQWWFGSMADEATLHALYKDKRTRGEWFELDEADLAEIQNYMRIRNQVPQIKHTI